MSVSFGSILEVVNATASNEPSIAERSPFHYIPTGWIGILFLALFGTITIVHLIQALYFRALYMIPTLVLCGITEVLGWVGRYWGHWEPLNDKPFMMQISTTIIAPSFMTAAMFLMLPKIINELGTEYSRMSPRLYGIIFLSADVTALVIQAVGGGLASSADNQDDAEEGGQVMLAGIVIQLVAVGLFTILALEFVIRFSYNRPARPQVAREPRKQTGWTDVSRKIIWMLVGLGIATVFMIIRSVYRTLELADGWLGEIIKIEKWFNWFDGAPIVIAMFAFNVFHPGYLLRNLKSENKLPRSQTPTVDMEMNGI